MAETIAGLQIELDDNLSQGAQAATDRLNKMADAADKAGQSTNNLSQSTTRVGPSFDAVNKKIDDNAYFTAQAEAASRKLQAALATLQAEFAKGAISEADLADKTAKLNAQFDNSILKANKQADAMRQMYGAGSSTSSAADQAASSLRKVGDAAQHGSEMTSGMTRELIVMGHEVVQGNWSNLGGSFLVLTERSKTLSSIVGSMLTGWGLLGTVAVAAIVAATYEAEKQDSQLSHLQQTLRATRDNYSAMAGEVEAAAKRIAAAGDFSRSDAFSAASLLAAQPMFTGTTDQMVDLLKVAGDVSVMLSKTLPEGMEYLTRIMADPAKAVQEMADQHLFGFNQALATAIERIQATGDKAAAATAALDQIKTHSADATKDGLTPLAEAWKGLVGALNTPGADGESLGHWFGKMMNLWIADMTRGLTRIVQWVEDVREAWGRLPNKSAFLPGQVDEYGRSMNMPVTGNSVTGANTPANAYQAPSTQAGIQDDIRQAAASVALDAELVSRLQAVEGILKNGQWQDNGTHRGPMQVADATFAGMRAQPGTFPITSTLNNLSNPTQNVQAGSEMLAYLLKKYGDPTLAILAYHDGETYIDKVLSSGGSLSASPAALDEARKVLSGYKGTGWSTADANLPIPPIPPDQIPSAITTTATSTGTGGVGGLSNTPESAMNAARKISTGTISGTNTELQAKLEALQKGQAEAAQGMDSFNSTDAKYAADSYNMISEAIGKTTAALQNNIPEQDKAIRQSALQTAALDQLNPVMRQMAEIEIQQREAVRNAGQDYDPSKTAQLQADALAKLRDSYNQNISSIDRTNDSQSKLIPIMEQGGQAADDAAAKLKAQEDAYTKLDPHSKTYTQDVQNETDALLRQSKIKRDQTAAQDIANYKNSNQMIEAEIALLGTDATTRAAVIAGMQEHLRITKDYTSALDDEGRKAVTAAQNNAVLQANYTHMQSSLTELSNIASNAFDQLSQGIVNAFTSGSGAAVNFGSIVKSVLASVLTQVAKLAIINPITNTLFGGNNPTLGSALSALAGNSSTQGGAGSGSSLTSIGTNIFSIGKDLYSGLTNFGAAGTEPLGALGNWSLSSIGIGDAPFTIADVGAANIGSPLALEAAQESAFAGGSAAGGTTLNSLLTSPIFGTNLTVAGGLGGLAAGYGAGTFVGGLVQQGLNKTGPGAQIGAGVGAAAGVAAAALAPETFGASLILAGLIGGTLGGAGGGLIGPHPASPYTSEQVTVTDSGQLALGRVASQGYDDTQELQALTQDLQTLNNFLTASGIKVGNKGGPGGGFQSPGELFQIGQNSPNGPIDPTKFASLADAFGKLNFTSDNSLLNDKVLSKLYDNFTDLSNAVGKFNTAQTGFTNYMASMDAAMEQVNKTTGALHDTLQGYTDQATAAVNQAEALIQTGMLSGDQTEKLIDAETKLWKVRDDATAAANAAVIAQNDQQNAGLNYRFAVANASLTGNPQDAENAALYQFDQVTAPQNRRQFSDYWVGVYGSAIKDTEGYTSEMAALERTLGEERLAIIKQYNDQITAQQQQAVTEAAQLAEQAQQERDQATNSATQLVQSIGQYLLKLETGSTSPLNSSSQYDLAKSQYSLMASGALGGNFTDSQQLTTYADAFLNSSRAQFGSGANYVSDFTNVLNDLSSLTGQGSDTLTNSAFVGETRTQTASLVDAINEVRNEIVNLRAQVQQSNLTPARVA